MWRIVAGSYQPQRSGVLTTLAMATCLIKFGNEPEPEPLVVYEFFPRIRRIDVVITRRRVRATPNSSIVARVRLKRRGEVKQRA